MVEGAGEGMPVMAAAAAVRMVGKAAGAGLAARVRLLPLRLLPLRARRARPVLRVLQVLRVLRVPRLPQPPNPQFALARSVLPAGGNLVHPPPPPPKHVSFPPGGNGAVLRGLQ